MSGDGGRVSVMTVSVGTAPVADPWPGQAMVPAVEVSRTAGLPDNYIRTVIGAGIFDDNRREGPGGRRMLSHDDAVWLLNAVTFAVATGIALSILVRALRGTGAQLSEDGGFMIPPPYLSEVA